MGWVLFGQLITLFILVALLIHVLIDRYFEKSVESDKAYLEKQAESQIEINRGWRRRPLG